MTGTDDGAIYYKPPGRMLLAVFLFYSDLLNPAKAELMYFPVFFGREKIKTIQIK